VRYLFPASLDARRRVLRSAGQRGPPLRRRRRSRSARRHHEPSAPVGRRREPGAPVGRLRERGGGGASAPVRSGHEPRGPVGRGGGAELHDPGSGVGGVAALGHEPVDLRLGQAHPEADGPAALGGRGERGRRRRARGGGEGEVGGGAAREHERLEPLPRADVERAGPGAARRGGRPGQRDEEVEAARAELRVVRQRPGADAQQLHLLRLEQLEPRVVAQHRARGRRRLHAERRAVQLHHLGALAPPADAVAHCSLHARGFCCCCCLPFAPGGWVRRGGGARRRSWCFAWFWPAPALLSQLALEALFVRSRLGRQGGIKKGRGEKARLLLLGPVGAEVKGDGEYSAQGQGRMHFVNILLGI
jgi:hypothetical protein